MNRYITVILHVACDVILTISISLVFTKIGKRGADEDKRIKCRIRKAK